MNDLNHKIVTVIGLGHVGLPTAAILAGNNFKVIGVDIDQNLVNSINQGNIQTTEPQLEILARESVKNGNLRASLYIEHSDVFIIAVPTPLTTEKKADLSIVNSAVNHLAPFLKKGDLLIIESTVPVNTTQKITSSLKKLRCDLKFPEFESTDHDVFITYCPERVLPGNIMEEIIYNDRIIGGSTDLCTNMAENIYKTFVKGKLLKTDSRTAEMTKLAENAYRDINIAFANELSMICNSLEIDTQELISLANHHPRVNILQPGPGVGGHCVAIDPWFIVNSSPKDSALIKTARKINDKKTKYLTSKIYEVIMLHKNPTVAFFGATYKNDVDDTRESPALKIIDSIAAKCSSRILLVDPQLNTVPTPLKKYSHLNMVKISDAIETADILIILVKHHEFTKIKWELIQGSSIIDSAGILPQNSNLDIAKIVRI